MGIYSYILLFTGLLLIFLVYSGTGKGKHEIIMLVMAVAVFLTVFFMIHNYFQKTCETLVSGDLQDIAVIVRKWGYAAPLASISLMVLQAIIAPIPAVLITAANGMVFGTVWGAIISWSGALLGALTAFYIAKIVRTAAVEKIINNRKVIDTIKNAGKKNGFYIILVSRLIPLISFDLISYAAGFSGIRLYAFLAATGIGMIPATIAYSFAGNKVPEIQKVSPLGMTAAIVVILLITAFSMAAWIRTKMR